ncbi:LysR family transcriptional regulator [Caldimonas tepidiphila]|uniref:LysR family transcriptional regulator n=1 Tax=Caldimonas tepidiphila TaxID=2315841 RepID=UPI00196A58EE|nr:LysR family transcriptional regulator [Caldimonas tepidiphila]
MEIDPGSLLLFARVADSGSFSRAAERAGQPKSTVSRRISELERQLGERLLLRTTRKLSLTDFGHHLLVHARQVAEEVDAAASLALHRQARPSGRLRVSLPSDPPLRDLPGFVAGFLRRHPEVSLELDVSARRVDLIGEGFDLALRMGELPDDATLVARRLFRHGWGLYASRDYLTLRGTPLEPEDLLRHDGLALRQRDGDALPWLLTQGTRRWEGLASLRATANSPTLLGQLIEQGLGIGPLPERHLGAPGGECRLVRVLPDWCLPDSVGWAVMPGRRLMPEKTRVFLEMLEQALQREGSR